MAQHSAIVGGSTAGRLLNCPGSWQATLALPPTADIPSEYAQEGSHARGDGRVDVCPPDRREYG